MYENILRFNEAEAKIVIERFINSIDALVEQAEEEVERNRGESDFAYHLEGTLDNYISLVDGSGYPGNRVVAEALETVENKFQSPLNNLLLYVIHYNDATEAKMAGRREKLLTEFEIDISNEIDEIMRKLEEEDERRQREEEERRKEEEEREKRRQERERRKKEQQEIEAEYEKTRSNLLRQVSRRRKAGLDLSDMVPDRPKRITRGSINNLNRIIEKIQDEYRYLSGRGYRGQPR